MSLKPTSLYIHIPWCAKKCPYCDFNSHALERRHSIKDNLPEQDYIHALEQDLASHAEYLAKHEIQTIFFGGGTPSLFSAEAIEKILGIVKKYHLKDDAEITLEANPGTAEQQKFIDFRAAGINRLSIGIQSFNVNHLEKLGRIHNAQEAIKAVETAHYAGFDNFNLDLMFGLPTQNIAASLHDIQTAIDLEPTHISHYQLTIEPETAFYKQPPILPIDDKIWEMQLQCQQRLKKYNYRQYEVSAYAKAGKQCQHNLNYWLFGDYVGIGAGAHGKYTHDHKIQRLSKVKAPFSFMRNAGKALCLDEQRRLNDDDKLFEFLLNALRLNEGFDLSLFTEKTRLDQSVLIHTLQRSIDDKLIELGTHCKTTAKGQQFLNTILSDVLPSSN